jgi:hypothetical protein
MLVLGTGDGGAGVLVVSGGVRDDDTALLSCSVARAAELEEANALLRAELDTAHLKLVEVDYRERTLTSENEDLKNDLENACTARDAAVNSKALVQQAE